MFLFSMKTRLHKAISLLRRKADLLRENHLTQQIFELAGKKTLIQGDLLTNKL